MKRRKAALLLGTVLLLLGTFGCGAKEKQRIILSAEEFFSYGTEAELTVENWEEFFELQPGPMLEDYNSGGTYICQDMLLVPKEFCVISGEQAELTVYGFQVGKEELYAVGEKEPVMEYQLRMELMEKVSIGDDKTAGTLALIYEEDKRQMQRTFIDSAERLTCTSIFRDGSIEDLVCIEADGRITSFVIPEEVWNVDEYGVSYLCIREGEDYFRIFEPTFYDDVRRYLKKTERLGDGV